MKNTTTSAIDPETQLGQLVRRNPEFESVFESIGIDYCCGGDAPLEQACNENDLEIQSVLERLKEAQSTDQTEAEYESLSAPVDNIVETHHHDYLRSELPSLERVVRKVVRVHGDSHPELEEEIESEFLDLKEEVTHHISDEEENVFPEILKLEDEISLTETEREQVQEATDHLESEHEAAASHLEQIRNLSNDYTIPDDACTSYRNMLDRLQMLEEDMHLHVHKENNVLFPEAEAMLAQLSEHSEGSGAR